MWCEFVLDAAVAWISTRVCCGTSCRMGVFAVVLVATREV
jgi:hypothetical protein